MLLDDGWRSGWCIGCERKGARNESRNKDKIGAHMQCHLIPIVIAMSIVTSVMRTVRGTARTERVINSFARMDTNIDEHGILL
jgi:hypothetical protein